MKAVAHSATTRIAMLVAVASIMLIVASPALAFDGARGDYLPVSFCATCHDVGSGLPVVPEWSLTGHASEGSVADSRANAYPVGRGPSCAGCHAGNYDPAKAVASASPVPTPSPTPTATTTGYSWPPAVPIWPSPIDNAYTRETFTGGNATVHTDVAVLGCSSCHGNVTSTAHMWGGLSDDEYQRLANPEICGQCHDRYAYNRNVYTIPTPKPTSLNNFHPQYPVGLNVYTGSLSDQMTLPDPAVSPPASGLWSFWAGGQSKKAHGEGAVQFGEWNQGGHKDALADLKALQPFVPDSVLNTCLKCHSSDYMLMEEAGKTVPTINTAKYGVTCQACHLPHDEGPTGATWNEERDPQLRAPQTELCTKCHTGEIATGAEYQPGDEVHHPMKEMMAGYGAIGVPENPSPHQGKCVECHMVPTGYENTGLRGTSANHRFLIVAPEEAAGQTTTVSVDGVNTTRNMPYSSCSTCHGSPDDPLATHLQDLIENRQQWITDKLAAIQAELNAAAIRMGYADFDTAYDAITAKAPGTRTAVETSFLSANTNRQFVDTEGSHGIHNWGYARDTVLTALAQARAAPWTPYTLTIKAGKSKVKAGKTIKVTGAVIPVDFVGGPMVVLQKKRAGGSWKTVKSVAPALPGGTYTISYRVAKGRQYLRTTFSSTSGRPTGTSKQVKVVGTT